MTEPEPEPCIHRWLLESPNGPTVQGTCKLCGEVRDYLSADPLDYFDFPLGAVRLGQSRGPTWKRTEKGKFK